MSLNLKIESDFLIKLKAFAWNKFVFHDKIHALREGTQREAFDAYTAGLEKGQRKGSIILPTGVGKTATFMALIESYLEATKDNPDAPRIMIVVPTERLVIQTARAFAEFLPEIAPTIEADDEQGKKIDWNNSDIGVQYHKRKHITRKPKVLITTYQSISRDDAREDERKIYKPDEYGLVCFDEAHVTTASGFGKAVDKFKDSLQIAVTATPEYTEDKTILARFPPYYNLSLKEAIKRGDLCDVRPVLLKTKFLIDEEKFHEFAKKEHGRNLSLKELQILLNHEARNRSALETYLRGRDIDSSERYFGQNGAIYCGGRQHADDIVRLANNMLDDSAYTESKRWLNEEGIELIAPVHGGIKGAFLRPGMMTDKEENPITVNRLMEGNKEWYSEDEIFDLHEKGKILLLASASKLKVGYDCRRDSIIIDLVDRFSKVEATQIFGRGFRLDPDNPDKIATVINLIDENTEKLYQENPNMMPIYCSEVIEGVEPRTAVRRARATRQFKQLPPDIDVSQFELITDANALTIISNEHKQKRAQTYDRAPDDDKGWISGLAAANAYGGTSRTWISEFEKLRDEKIREGLPIQEIQAHWIALYYYRNKKTPYIMPAKKRWKLFWPGEYQR